MELWEDGMGKFVTGFRFLIFKIVSLQDNLKSKLRHAVTYYNVQVTKNRGKNHFALPRAPLGRNGVNDLCFSPDNVFSIGCINCSINAKGVKGSSQSVTT